MEKCTLKIRRETIKGGKTGWEQNVGWCCGNRNSEGRGADCSSSPDFACSVPGTWDGLAATSLHCCPCCWAGERRGQGHPGAPAAGPTEGDGADLEQVHRGPVPRHPRAAGTLRSPTWAAVSGRWARLVETRAVGETRDAGVLCVWVWG